MARMRRGGWSWGADEGAVIRVLSLGCGIQSTTMALMAVHGEIGPLPDCAIFADTGAESTMTLEHLRWLQSGNVLNFPIFEVSNGSLTDNIERRAAGDSKRFVAAPFFTDNGGMGRRQCTREFKIAPINRKIRELLGYRPGQRIPPGACETWIGISTDEVVRAGAATDRWATNRFPLLEQRMSRHDCVQWLRKHAYPVPPKSACVFCPYRSNAEWRALRDTDPDGFDEAIRIDALVRNTPSMRHKEYIHRSLTPLADVDFRPKGEAMGQGWLLECQGGCGL